MAAPITETEDQREQRLSDVARLYLQGKTQTAIGKALGVTQQQICYDLKIVRKRWLDSSIRNFDEARAQELAKIDRVEAEFWAAWNRSQRIKQVTGREAQGGHGREHRSCDPQGRAGR